MARDKWQCARYLVIEIDRSYAAALVSAEFHYVVQDDFEYTATFLPQAAEG